MKQDGEETQAGGGWESGFLNGGNILFFDLGGIYIGFCLLMVAQLVKNPPAMRETWVQFLGWEDPLERGKAAHSSVRAWRIPCTIQSQSQT